MNLKILFSAICIFFIIQACSITKNTVTTNKEFWVSGFKTTADAGAGERQVLNVYRGNDLDNAKWENFYAPIEGFEFEKGYLQKIEVKETQLEKNSIPADASAIKYTLVKVLDKQKDLCDDLDGSWTLVRLNDKVLNIMVTIPTMSIDLSKMRISGNSGCNNFTGGIKMLSAAKINLSPLVSTKKMCNNKNVEDEFNVAINGITTFQLKGDMLTFFNKKGGKVLTFIKG